MQPSDLTGTVKDFRDKKSFRPLHDDANLHIKCSKTKFLTLFNYLIIFEVTFRLEITYLRVLALQFESSNAIPPLVFSVSVAIT